jgi:predicted RNA-binding protein
MCCLRYEHDFYVQSRKRFPKEGKVLVTARGEEKVVANDIFNDRVTLRTVEGDIRVVPLAELKQELEQRTVAVVEHEEEPAPAEATTEELAVEEAPVAALQGEGAPHASRERGETEEGELRDRRPHRRRGRRGGRRSRPGGDTPRDATREE